MREPSQPFVPAPPSRHVSLSRDRGDDDILPPRRTARPPEKDPTVFGFPRGAAVWIVGGALAPLFAATPILQYMAWFLSSLVHEMGHTAVAWLMGCSAFPAIRLDGHAATPTAEQSRVAAYGMWIALAAGSTWLWRTERKRTALLVAAAVIAYPMIALDPVRRPLAHLLGGHLGELAFATLALHRALTGRATAHLAERVAYAMVGWYLWGHNVGLTYGLATDAAARDHYEGNGSFGLTNDYLRVADDILDWPLTRVAWVATLAAIPVPVIAWLVSRRNSEA
ncbi:MAG: hypothetical protein K8T90_21245 [Planctomycetes bacterium]|nr:hypothetical protein [Planctomycetota bacterium]